MTDFSTFSLDEKLLQAISEQGYETPTPVQQQAIPPLLKGRDVLGVAQTGTGKTAAFALPILQIMSRDRVQGRRVIRALVLSPTRELAAQIDERFAAYGTHLDLRHRVIFGGVSQHPQVNALRRGIDILVATPGRLLDLINQGHIDISKVEFFVLDEADRMLDMGFIHDIKRIIKLLPVKRQTLMFSATFSEDIRKLAKSLVHNPVEISVTPRNTTVEAIKHWICPVDKSKKTALLTHLINKGDWQQVLVFSRTKHGANRIATSLDKKNITATAIHGNKSQGARTRALADFKAGKVRVLVATDIAARGIDIDQLPHVINFDLPNVPEDYIHRIGRTGRAGRLGEAISLVSADEAKQLFDIERLIQKHLERELIEYFWPSHDVPNSPELRPNKDKRPKKPKQRNDSSHNKHEGRKSEQTRSRKPKRRVFSAKKTNRNPKPKT